MGLNAELLALLVCPRCKGPLTADPERGGLGCSGCCVLYPVVDDVPVMIFEESRPWTPPAASAPARG